MATHADVGADLLLRYPDFAKGASIVRFHHERWDGRGYPHKRRGTDIPLGARIVAVADSYDAMTSNRPYGATMGADQAVAILRAGGGAQWDAKIVEAFVAVLESKGVLSLAPASRQNMPLVASTRVVRARVAA